MVVDDDKGIRKTMGRILESMGYRVVTAENGTAAIFLAQNDAFDVALIDFKMNGLNGAQTCETLRRINRDAGLYIVTAHVTTEMEEAALAGGASGVLHKPVDVPKLLSIVESHKGAACAAPGRECG